MRPVNEKLRADLLEAGKREFMEYPNREWGYGTLNVYQSLDRLRQL